MYNYLNKELETMDRKHIAELQNERLKAIIAHTAKNSPWSAERYRQAGIDPFNFKGLSELHKLPFSSKADFREQYPLGMSCVPIDKLAEMHMSSGSTGTPVVMPMTQHDLKQWSQIMGRCYIMSGAKKGDTCQITPAFGLFNGGFGCYHGAREAGLFVVPTGSGNTVRQIKLAKDFGTRVLVSVVSYSIRLMEILEQTKQTLPELEIGIFGAESFSPEMKKRIHDGLGIDAFDIYGMTETGGIGLGMDCPAHEGIHIWEDHYIVEIVDHDTGEPVPDGEFGEVVITALTREALPVIRFKTSDRGRILTREKCACGRTHLRLDTISGRLDDMLIISGVNFFPSQIEQSLLKIPGVLPNYQIVIRDNHGIKSLRVNVEAEEGVTGFMVEKQLKEDLGFSPEGDIYKPGELPRTEGKAKRIIYETIDNNDTGDKK